jgi:hypothetical protein
MQALGIELPRKGKTNLHPPYAVSCANYRKLFFFRKRRKLVKKRVSAHIVSKKDLIDNRLTGK